MEHSVGTVIDTVGSDEKGDKENNDNKTCDSEPVVYQLVRVIDSVDYLLLADKIFSQWLSVYFDYLKLLFMYIVNNYIVK